MHLFLRKGIWLLRHISHCFSFFLSILVSVSVSSYNSSTFKNTSRGCFCAILLSSGQASCIETWYNMSVVNTSGERDPTSPQHYSTYLRPTSRFLSLSCVWCLQQLGRGLVETSHVRLWVSPGWVSVGHIFSHPPSFSYARTLFQQWLQVTLSDRLVYPLRPVHPSVSLSLLRSCGRRWWSAHKLQPLSLEAHSLLSTGHSEFCRPLAIFKRP